MNLNVRGGGDSGLFRNTIAGTGDSDVRVRKVGAAAQFPSVPIELDLKGFSLWEPVVRTSC
jgi:hypothetical protein